MKKRLISLILISTLSLLSLVGCAKTQESFSDNTSNTNVGDSTSSNDETPKKDTNIENKNEDINKDSNTSNNTIVTDSSIIEAFTNALNELYNLDYSIKSNKDFAKEYASSKFSKEGFTEFIDKLNYYNSKFKASDILITKVTEVENKNTSYVKAYDIRYNVTITEGKASVYSDLIGVVLEDKNGNLFIQSINQNNF